MQSSRRSQAAAEACELYRTLLRRGWKAVVPQRGTKTLSAHPRLAAPAPADVEKLDRGYWAQRLIHREYTMGFDSSTNHELSVRIDHGGTGCYFPLKTGEPLLAARRALQIYQTIADAGWKAANWRFSRELTVACRWLDMPLAWTYTTIHTLIPVSRDEAQGTLAGAPPAFEVALTESDAGRYLQK